METSASELFVRALAEWGLRRVYLSADGAATPLGEALQRSRALHAVIVNSGRTAAYAAAAEARLTGRIALCCAEGSTDTLPMLGVCFEAQLSSAPVVVLSALPGSSPLGTFDAPHLRPEALLQDCCVFCRQAGNPELLLTDAAAALLSAQARRGVSVLTIPSDIASAPVGEMTVPPLSPASAAATPPDKAILLRMAALINSAARVTFLCGIGAASAKQELVTLARRVRAPLAYTLCAKDAMEGDNPCEVGMTGLLGWGAAPVAVADCDLLVLWGTDFPFTEFLPTDTPVIQVDTNEEALGRRIPLALGVHGDAQEVARALFPLIRRNRGDDHLAAARCHHRRRVAELESAVRSPDESAPLRPEYITRLVSDLAEPDAVFTVDTGAPLLWAARYLRTADTRKLLGSFRVGTQTCALASAIGAKSAYPSRQVIALCRADCLQLAELQAILNNKLSVKILAYNPTEKQGQHPCHLADMLRPMGFSTERITTANEAGTAVKQWLSAPGPAMLEAVTDGSICASPPSLRLNRGAQRPLGFTLSCGLKELHRRIYGQCSDAE